jgi:Uma2 family endonuclease
LTLTDNIIEVLPMSTDNHQAISRLLFLALLDFVHAEGGTVFYAPLRVQVRPGTFREPDLLILLDCEDPRRQNAYWLGADIVVDIIDHERQNPDHDQTPRDYAEAGIPEYWSVDPVDQTITVHELVGRRYVPHGAFRRGQIATSVLLEDFTVDVAEVFDTR